MADRPATSIRHGNGVVLLVLAWALVWALVLGGCGAPEGAEAPENPDAVSTRSSPSPPDARTPPAPSPTQSSQSSAPQSSAPATSSEGSVTESPTPSPTTSAVPPYAASVHRVGPGLRERMRFSHRAGCPVPLRDLRYLRMRYLGFDGSSRTGEMVVHQDHARDVVRVFRRLYEAGWPIRRMRLVDAYRGDDARSMAANNTSGYNCRRVAGSSSWSRHAYGEAIDVNPVQNPYVRQGSVQPPAGRRFADLDRSPGAEVPRGVIRAGGVAVAAFAEAGWGWGGDWSSSKDYQHFSVTGG